MRDRVLTQLIEAYAVVLVIEGDDPRANKRVAQAVQGALETWEQLRPRLPKPVKVGPDNNSGNDDNDMPIDDTVPNPDQGEIPGSDKTILNKPSPSFFHGVYRAAFDLLGLSISVRI